MAGNPNIKDHAHKGGRPKGSKDKISRTVKTRIIEVWNALEAKGESLEKHAEEDPKWFYREFVKGMIPKEVEADLNIKGGVKLITNVKDRPS